jgi:hypothetical protein
LIAIKALFLDPKQAPGRRVGELKAFVGSKEYYDDGYKATRGRDVLSSLDL